VGFEPRMEVLQTLLGHLVRAESLSIEICLISGISAQRYCRRLLFLEPWNLCFAQNRADSSGVLD